MKDSTMRLSQLFPSKFIKCSDLEGKRIKVVIDKVSVEQVSQDPADPPKPVLHFKGGSKALVLNKTNAEVIGNALGDDTDRWIGQTIILAPARTQYQGKLVDCIRVTLPAAAPPPIATAAPPADEVTDDLPF
jgi:hypothetical protein